MSLSSCNSKVMKAYLQLYHRLSQTQCYFSCSSLNGNMRLHFIKCTAPAHVHVLSVCKNAGVQRHLPLRTYSMQNCDRPHNRILKEPTKLCQYAKALSDTAKVSFSTFSRSSKDHDKLYRYRQSERCLHGTGEDTLLSLPPADSIEKMRNRYKCLQRKKSRFVLHPHLAKLMVDKVWPNGDLSQEKALIVETSPGPGILTRELLNSGAPRVLAMEREKTFLQTLGSLASHSEGRLRAMHADFFSMHYHGTNMIKPPIVRISQVFNGMEPVPWEADIPIKVIGSLPHRRERTHAYIITSQLLERLSSFKYGRVEFNIFMSESCYDVISHQEGNMFKYRALSALMQLSCDIELLHKEPQVSFSTFFSGEPSKSNAKDQTLCLVRITPKRDLFINHQLSQQQAFLFVYFVRQLLVKRKQHLGKIIESWAPGHEDIIHKFGYNNKTRTGDVKPADLLRIYIIICQLESFNGSWMGEEVIGYASRALEIDEDEMFDSIASQGVQN